MAVSMPMSLTTRMSTCSQARMTVLRLARLSPMLMPQMEVVHEDLLLHCAQKGNNVELHTCPHNKRNNLSFIFDGEKRTEGSGHPGPTHSISPQGLNQYKIVLTIGILSSS
uniref:Uncharacterized protein n=1 Tax=Oryza sativa subsp. japonica TaxID=39947 RepID=Q69UK4_ORYSJ|nr:hypothetical protein [Oryza sativa Japonica Group]